MPSIRDLFPNTIKLTVPLRRFPAVTGPCWIWTGQRREDYGWCRYHGRLWPVHRLALMLARPNELLPNLHACHKCDVRACCNPDHLFVGTEAQNHADLLKWTWVVDGAFIAGDYEQWRERLFASPIKVVDAPKRVITGRDYIAIDRGVPAKRKRSRNKRGRRGGWRHNRSRK